MRSYRKTKAHFGGDKRQIFFIARFLFSYVIFVSNVADAKVAVYYAQRWGIEVLFGDLKSRGFNFEDTHVTNMESIKK